MRKTRTRVQLEQHKPLSIEVRNESARAKGDVSIEIDRRYLDAFELPPRARPDHAPPDQHRDPRREDRPPGGRTASLFSARSKRFQTLLDGEPRVLVHDGKIIPQSLMAERVTPEEVMSEMRKAGFDQLDQIRWAILESDGKISVVPKAWAAHRAPQQAREKDARGG